MIFTQWFSHMFWITAGPKLLAGFILPPVNFPFKIKIFSLKYYLKFKNQRFFTPNKAPTVTDKPIVNGAEPPKSVRVESIQAKTVRANTKVITNSIKKAFINGTFSFTKVTAICEWRSWGIKAFNKAVPLN